MQKNLVKELLSNIRTSKLKCYDEIAKKDLVVLLKKQMDLTLRVKMSGVTTEVIDLR